MKRKKPLLARRLDLPLARDGSGRFLPWIIALMVYLAALSLGGMIVLRDAVARWDSALAGTLTVQVPPGDKDAVDRVVTALRRLPGIAAAEPLDDAANARLLEPWLGSGAALQELQLPRLVDVRLAPDAALDRGAIAGALNEAAPGARLADDRRWLEPLFATAAAIETLALVIVLLVGAAAVLSIVFATRTSLAIHHGAVEVLHLIGAHDGYIAGQFQWQALRLGLRGSAMGLALAAATALALHAAGGERTPLGGGVAALPHFTLTPVHLAALLLLAPAAGLIALVTARWTALSALSRMP